MTKILLILAVITVLCLIIVWILGPRQIIVAEPNSCIHLPENLDAYITNRETSTSSPLKKDTEAKIIWQHTDKRKTEYAIVYLHGFTSSRKEISPVVETIANQLGANAFFTRFTGHGSVDGELLKRVEVDDWMNDSMTARAIAERIGEKVILVGTSQGGLLATWVAQSKAFKTTPAALVLISPNFAPKDSRTNLLTLPWGKQILPKCFGSHQPWEPQNEAHKRFWNTNYPSEALFPMMAQVNYITPRAPQNIDIPVLVLYSQQDLTVKSQAIEDAFEKFPSEHKQIVKFPTVRDRKQHILAGEILSPSGTQKAIDDILMFLSETGVVDK